jgi:hypothetical protein
MLFQRGQFASGRLDGPVQSAGPDHPAAMVQVRTAIDFVVIRSPVAHMQPLDAFRRSADLIDQPSPDRRFSIRIAAAEVLLSTGKTLWVVTDGAYAKRPFVRPALEVGATLVGRLRKDSALRDLPPREKTKRRGRQRKYGPNRISLIKRAANRHGWIDVACLIYGQEVVKRVKTFLATHPTFGGAIRVVIVKEPAGPQFFYCTDTSANVREIVATFADRSAIEQVFHDVKEVWGSGQQQVRNLWSNLGCWHLNLWLFTLVELWAWKRSAKELTHRADSPWDDALQAACLAAEFSAGPIRRRLPRKIRDALQRLLRIAM